MMTLLDAEVGKTYEIKEIQTDDEDMNAFLFRLGRVSSLTESFAFSVPG